MFCSNFKMFKSCTAKQPVQKPDINTNHVNPLTLSVSDIDFKDTVPFVPPVHGGYVVKVYDGDTITIATKLPIIPVDQQPVYRFSVRLNGIDTPEMKGSDDEEKECARRAKEFMIENVMNKQVKLEDVQLEKYGRLLATVISPDNKNMNELMVQKRYAVKYDGGTKICPKSWQRYYDNGSLD